MRHLLHGFDQVQIALSTLRQTGRGLFLSFETSRGQNFNFKSFGAINNPRSIGETLKSSSGELWRYRVGDWRIITRIEDEVVRILVVRIGHRKEVYRWDH